MNLKSLLQQTINESSKDDKVQKAVTELFTIFHQMTPIKDMFLDEISTLEPKSPEDKKAIKDSIDSFRDFVEMQFGTIKKKIPTGVPMTDFKNTWNAMINDVILKTSKVVKEAKILSRTHTEFEDFIL